MRYVDYAWLLPGALAEGEPESRRIRRTARDWIVDILAIVAAAGFAVLVADELRAQALSSSFTGIDQIVGGLGCVALWLRRRWPVQLALVLAVLSAFFLLVQGAVLIALFTVVVHRPFRTAAWVIAANVAAAPVFIWLRPNSELPLVADVALAAVILTAVIGWGMFVRSRRQLVLSLRERAQRAEAETRLRADQARHLERERIAREMHDVLAHRLSLLSVHAGALEYRADAPAPEVAAAAGVIRTAAHDALQDLREVIGVLRSGSSPGAAGVPELVEESRQAGMDVTLLDRVADLDAVPGAAGRSAYRIVQEGLTNARKHAPDAPVTVTVSGSPGAELTVEVCNPVAGGDGAIPGSGLGLIGLGERVGLAGGRLEHGLSGSDEFRLRASLPWPA